MIIKILGSGCANCVNLERVTREAIADLGIDAQFAPFNTSRRAAAW